MRKLLLLVSAVVLVDTSFYAAITPLLPDLTEQFGLSKSGAGLLAAAYPVGTFVGGLRLKDGQGHSFMPSWMNRDMAMSVFSPAGLDRYLATRPARLL